ncbi:hypothetical protein FBUS_02925 [Fasciolopsis buskii]|uniref:WW domain-containing protein n=1 Tax=Fasciolopsis buskii TaxID=27845 RepID=A0A8E0RP47_9TREM|nr:hypothetical protein FBUS_02925 [Fasciolopsis buski]
MLDDRPLPPNWESRLDPSTQQWFFVDHVNKKTSWDDPRPAYYSARQRKRSTSVSAVITVTSLDGKPHF